MCKTYVIASLRTLRSVQLYETFKMAFSHWVHLAWSMQCVTGTSINVWLKETAQPKRNVCRVNQYRKTTRILINTQASDQSQKNRWFVGMVRRITMKMIKNYFKKHFFWLWIFLFFYFFSFFFFFSFFIKFVTNLNRNEAPSARAESTHKGVN